MKHRQHSQKDANAPGAQGGFRLPSDVSFSKQQLPYATAYVFRHRLLGELGRIVIEETSDGRTRLSFEVVGDPNDPMTAERAAIFQPLGMELARQMEAATGPTADAVPSGPPPRPPEPKEVIESRLIPCERCGRAAAMLIFAPQATDPGRFEDYARKMYPEYTVVPTRVGVNRRHVEARRGQLRNHLDIEAPPPASPAARGVECVART